MTDPLQIGDLLIPKDTPLGPAEARTGWARGLGNLLNVVALSDDHEHIAYARSGGWPSVKARTDLAAVYERPDGRPIR